MKTPDDVKKGLECCKPIWKNDHWKTCDRNCPYAAEAVFCRTMLNGDALALIQQLQAQNAEKDARIQQLESDKQQLEGLLTHMNQLRDAAAGRALQMEERVHQLEAERDAAVKELKRIGKCVCCKHDKLCTFIFPNCVECEKTDCPCHTCEYRSNWEWRGVTKEE